MKKRILKVYSAPNNQNNIPRINLQGKWLSNLGYNVGDHITVSYDEQGIITIVINKNSNL